MKRTTQNDPMKASQPTEQTVSDVAENTTKHRMANQTNVISEDTKKSSVSKAETGDDAMYRDDLASYLFHQGTNDSAYEYLGAHRIEDMWVFRVWAPNADKVALVGDFCDWEDGIAMRRVTDGGVWQVCVPVAQAHKGDFYKYKITNGGLYYLKADPYGIFSQTLQHTASILWEIDDFVWSDEEWMKNRGKPMHTAHKESVYEAPLNIYEMHLGSWRTRGGESTVDGRHYLNYREIARLLVPYLKDMGYTHVELLPIAEHPFDGSWGYQICSYYAPTSRFGTPQDFQFFIDYLHQNGIGVFLDWVPAHFPKDRHGLYEFDGQPLYEYQGRDRMEHRGWGTRCFDVGREEVQSFLISNALFWMRKYHVDGLRIDAVASMLYLDYDRAPGEWIPNKYGNNHNLEAISFFQKLNGTVRAAFDDVLMIAEESTAWPKVTRPPQEGGLGFHLKWNMGWANDMFAYVAMDPIYRSYHHDKLTFPMMYAFSEHYVLPVSHDEVVHGKCSLVNKMWGDYDQKFAQMRTFLTLQMTFPGKKLLFMGTEYAQMREWDYENQLEWFMTSYPRHAEMQRYVRALNHLYLETPALWEIDDSWEGFTWIETEQRDWSMISYRRRDRAGRELLVILNFCPVTRENYAVRVPSAGVYEEILASDAYCFGGGGVENKGALYAAVEEDCTKDCKDNHVSCDDGEKTDTTLFANQSGRDTQVSENSEIDQTQGEGTEQTDSQNCLTRQPVLHLTLPSFGSVILRAEADKGREANTDKT